MTIREGPEVNEQSDSEAMKRMTVFESREWLAVAPSQQLRLVRLNPSTSKTREPQDLNICDDAKFVFCHTHIYWPPYSLFAVFRPGLAWAFKTPEHNTPPNPHRARLCSQWPSSETVHDQENF